MTPYIEFSMLRRTTPGRSYDILPYRYVNARIFENSFFPHLTSCRILTPLYDVSS
jgi:hypothetical protein